MKRVPRRLLNLALFVGTIGVFGTSALYTYNSTNRLLDLDATRTSQQWATSFVTQIQANDSFLNDGTPTLAQLSYIEAATRSKPVFRVKLFDAKGQLRLVSDQGQLELEDISLHEHNPDVAAGVFAGKSFVEVLDGRSKPNRPDVYAEAYMPLIRDGQVVGVVEVYVDQTAARALYKGTLDKTLFLLTLLGLLAALHAVFTSWIARREQQAQARITHLALNDELTGIPNRAQFHARLAQALKDARSERKAVAVHMIDLDGFKGINDSLGHIAGDTILQDFAVRLAALGPQVDMVARLSGDEFAILQTGVRNANAVERLATLVVATARDIREVGGTPVRVGASVGIAYGLKDASQPSDLLKCADIALYQAKEGGRGKFVTYEASMNEALRERMELRNRLADAIESGDLVLHFQPLHASDGSGVKCFEALVRLVGTDGRLISPAVFVPVAEEMGLTHAMGAWVLNEACREAMTWPDNVRVAVNLSPQQFEADIVGVVAQALKASGLSAKRLELEVTEGLFLNDGDLVTVQLGRLRDLGVRIAMDDFGTGYSSLSYLWKFPFDKIKVDRSCFTALGEDEKVGKVLRTITAMGRSMNLSVTAEGIETQLQADFARDAGYDEQQGYLYARPMEAVAVAGHLLRNAADRLQITAGTDAETRITYKKA